MADEARKESAEFPKTDEEWRRHLTPEQYAVCRQHGTERAFSGEYWNAKTAGIYRCVGCGWDLFSSETKFDSGTGWPSFWQALDKSRIKTVEDTGYGTLRIEIRCARCESHLGHVFPDGPRPTGQRYCVNSASLKLDPKNT